MMAISEELSRFKYDDDLEATGGTRFQTNHVDNRIRIVDVTVCKASKAFRHQFPWGRILAGLYRLYGNRCLGDVDARL